MMRSVQRVGTVFLVISLTLVAGDSARGYSWFQAGGINVVWFGNQSLRYLSPSTFPEGSDPDIHYLSAMGQWSSVPAADFQFSFSRLAEDLPIDQFDGFSDTAAVPASSLDPGVLAVTYLVNSGTEWFDMDMLFSDLPLGVGYTFEPNPDCDQVINPTPSNGFSFLLIALHELGHAIGLGHDPIGDETPGTPFLIATMNPRYPNGGPVGQQNIIELHTDDRNGARFLYPNSGPSGPPITDLANGSYSWGTIVGAVIPVFFTPTAVDPGAELTMRSVIENFGTTNEFFVRQGFYLSTDSVIDSGDMLIADVLWDLAFEDAIDFDISLDMPADLPSGDYFVGSIFDDLDDVVEVYEDNNHVVYCEMLTVTQLAPVFSSLGQDIIPCSQPYTSSEPQLSHPLNMATVTWSIDFPEPGMTINSATGVVSWPDPAKSPFLYTVNVRATNAAGTSTQLLFIGVDSAAPDIEPVADEAVLCAGNYVGPTPSITSPGCMEPIINWSIDAGPFGMTINNSTGVVSWFNALPAAQSYTITIRATNSVGNGTQTWKLQVLGGDLDGDGFVTLTDWSLFEPCITGPEGLVGAGCDCADSDVDGDVDLDDLAVFQNATGF